MKIKFVKNNIPILNLIFLYLYYFISNMNFMKFFLNLKNIKINFKII